MNEQYLALSLASNNPNDPRHIVQPGTGYDGVVLLELPNNEICTGSLLWSGKHILTAAHCLQNNNSFPLTPHENKVTAVFQLTLGDVRLEAKEIFIHPQWNYSAEVGENSDNDIAIIELEAVAPPTAERYSIYRRSDEVGQIFTRVGYGIGGTGLEGKINSSAIIKRFGGNRYDALKEGLVPVELQSRSNIGKQLVYDFDSGFRRHDALGREYSLHDLGLIGYDLQDRTSVFPLGIIGSNLVQDPLNPSRNSELEIGQNSPQELTLGNLAGSIVGRQAMNRHSQVASALGNFTGSAIGQYTGQQSIGRHYEAGSTSGDSGSPAFIEGKIAGIASSGRRSTLPQADITDNRDSSFGEIFFDTRVSAYADFIDEKVNSSNQDIFLLQMGLEAVLLGLMVSAIASRFFRL